MVEIKVPQMGESISQANVVGFLKKEGDLVKADDEILELETDKVNHVIFAPAAGVLHFVVQVGDSVEVGQTLATLSEGAAEVSKAPLLKQEAPKAEVPKPIETPKPAQITAPTSKGPENRRKLPKIRQVIAERLLQAVKTTAMLTTFNEVDMTAVLEAREHHKKAFEDKHGVKLGFMAFFIKAAVSALKAFPGVNSYIDGDEMVERLSYDMGIAVSTERGLVVPVVRSCDALTFPEIEKKIGTLAEAARKGGLTLDDLKGGSFTITNGGVFGSMLSTPILNPPQAAILGMHKIQKRAVVIDDQIVIRPIMYLALSYDHRVIDGKEAVSFLVHIKQEIEDPSRLLLDI